MSIGAPSRVALSAFVQTSALPLSGDRLHPLLPDLPDRVPQVVPRMGWWLYPPFGGAYDEAATIHDHLYAHAELFEGDDHGHLSRGEADGVIGGARPWASVNTTPLQRTYHARSSSSPYTPTVWP